MGTSAAAHVCDISDISMRCTNVGKVTRRKFGLSRVKGRAQLSCPIASLMNRNGKAVRVASPEEAI
jgi:hypothetical protein